MCHAGPGLPHADVIYRPQPPSVEKKGEKKEEKQAEKKAEKKGSGTFFLRVIAAPGT